MRGIVIYKYIRGKHQGGRRLFLLKDHDGTRTNGYKLTMKVRWKSEKELEGHKDQVLTRAKRI